MNNLFLQIQEEIARHGPISFARFMELALYAPSFGYYERQREIGRQGDFFTSVSVGPLFGELLAFQFAQWMDREGKGGPLQIVETGAHDGALAADILCWLQRRRPDLYERLQYGLVEPSPTRRGWQEQKLRDWLPTIKWARDVTEAGATQAYRIIFSNELLDAMPAHRLAWDAAAGRWQECRVALDHGKFAWQKSAPSAELAARLPKIAAELAAVLPDGFLIEYSANGVAWWKKAAKALGSGKLLTIDYGFTAGEQFRPERSSGALRAFARHHGGGDLLDNPGDCDITAHVDFSAIEEAGRAAGLITEGLTGQDKFLTEILAQTEAEPGSFDEWTPTRVKQFQTLTHPEHLGRAFRVLIQSR